MAEGIEKCTFGMKLNSTCHLQHYAKKSFLLQVKNLTQEEQRLLLIWSSISDINTDEATICLHHKAVYLNHFTYSEISVAIHLTCIRKKEQKISNFVTALN